MQLSKSFWFCSPNTIFTLHNLIDLSIGELISQFFEQGVALTWDAFEHEAKQKREERLP